MAKLLSVAHWPEDGQSHPDYPVEFQLTLLVGSVAEGAPPSADWATCQTSLFIQRTRDGQRELLLQRTGHLPRRDLQRLATDLTALLQQQSRDQLTFIPVTPCFELWLSRLSDDQYRVIVWQDLADSYGGASDIAYQGLRFMTNRARLFGFARSLEADLKGTP
jgi:hypothetical protein